MKTKRAASSKRAMNPLVRLRAVTIPDKRKKAAREACRRKKIEADA